MTASNLVTRDFLWHGRRSLCSTRATVKRWHRGHGLSEPPCQTLAIGKTRPAGITHVQAWHQNVPKRTFHVLDSRRVSANGPLASCSPGLVAKLHFQKSLQHPSPQTSSTNHEFMSPFTAAAQSFKLPFKS